MEGKKLLQWERKEERKLRKMDERGRKNKDWNKNRIGNQRDWMEREDHELVEKKREVTIRQRRQRKNKRMGCVTVRTKLSTIFAQQFCCIFLSPPTPNNSFIVGSVFLGRKDWYFDR